MDNDITQLGFEEAMIELDKIVRQMETGTGKLDEAIRNYTRGMALMKHCETKLKEAQLKVDQLTKGENGSITTEPYSGR